MKKAEIPRDRLSTALCTENHIGSEREENQQYRKTSCNKDHFAVRIPEYLRYQHQVAGIDPAHGKRKHIQLLPDTDSKTHSYLF